MKGSGEKREYSEIHLARIYLLMASCCAMPAPTRAIQSSGLQPLPAKSICHIAILTLTYGAIDGGEHMNTASPGRQYDAIDWALQCYLIDLCFGSPCKRVASSLYIADGVIMQQALPPSPTPSRSFSPLSPFCTDRLPPPAEFGRTSFEACVTWHIPEHRFKNLVFYFASI